MTARKSDALERCETVFDGADEALSEASDCIERVRRR
jgi:hypothetical protein